MARVCAEGASTFFVARLAEAVDARAVAPAATIYVLDGYNSGAAQIFAAHDLRPVLGSLPEIDAWRQGFGRQRPAALHVDTGMNRLGLGRDEIDAGRAMLGDVDIALVISHFTSSENPDAADNLRQIERFKALPSLGRATSLANSSGIFLPSKPWFDLVRPGYALYGGNPTPGRPNPMRAVATLTAPILRTRDIAAGETVGYNNRWTARKPSRVATIALGYADGIPRGAAATDDRPGPDVAIGGRRCPIAGRISMDLITIDVSGVDAALVVPGAPVEILGETIGVDEFGERAGTIGYEILTSLGRRYRRIYRGMP
jgi:alanine racemase